MIAAAQTSGGAPLPGHDASLIDIVTRSSTSAANDNKEKKLVLTNFEKAKATAWFAKRRAPVPRYDAAEGDAEWFAARPGRSHRLRHAQPEEVDYLPDLPFAGRAWFVIARRRGSSFDWLFTKNYDNAAFDLGEHEARNIRTWLVYLGHGIHLHRVVWGRR